MNGQSTKEVKTASQIIQNLRNFNRKERDHLIKFALSDSPEQPQVSKDLWRAIRPKNGSKQRPKPSEMFIGMDYHLNWLYAALMVPNDYHDGISGQENCWPDSSEADENGEPIRPNQEDVDLIVAFHANDELYITLIEAKLSSGWDIKQFESKFPRLCKLKRLTQPSKRFGLTVKWRLMLASPSTPSLAGPYQDSDLLALSDWETESKDPRYTRFHFPLGPDRLFHVKRETDAGTHWQVLPVQLKKQ